LAKNSKRKRGGGEGGGGCVLSVSQGGKVFVDGRGLYLTECFDSRSQRIPYMASFVFLKEKFSEGINFLLLSWLFHFDL
jgi:hypothetical protein